VNLVAIAAGAYLAPVAFAARASSRRSMVAAFVVVAVTAVTVLEAHALAADAASARAVERDAPLGSIALKTLRKATDRDHDGASPWFGGGDCDDKDPRRAPSATDVPDNGVDEDCSGADLHLTVAADTMAPREATPPPKPELPADLNLIVITVDTLRTDVGFMGYRKPTTPHLDALAERSVVFDHMYAFSSYTGKSIGPLFIGKYPSETKRDGGHFNTYAASNVFLAERAREAGLRTFGAASHWYFLPWSGLSQGMDAWDLAARPGEGQGDNDTSVTSKEVSDVAIRMMKKPENVGRRFFAWFHYFDPHEQYMPHDDAPSFGTGNKAAYDGEVWFTDKHIGRLLDYVASQPWGARTAIVVTADHGETFGEHNMRWHGYELWEPLVHVPFFIYVPGVAPSRVPVKRSHVDFVPTLLDVLGIAQPAAGELSGVSDAPDLVSHGVYDERDVMLDMPPGPFTGMRQGLIHGATPGMKLIRFESGAYSLFDLVNDPDEKEDLASDKERLAPMVDLFLAKRAGLAEIVVKADAPPPAP
jgi:arylsulfatase A-like enzyme